MTKKRIALLLPSLANGGAERVMLNIARGLADDSDLLIDIVLCKAEGPYMEQVPDNIRVIDLKSSRIISATLPLIRYLKKEKPASVLSALDTTNLILIWAAGLARSTARLVVSVHCNFSSALKGQQNIRSKFLPLLVRIFYRKADKVLAVSQGVADDLVECTGVKRDQLTVQVNPVITPELVHKARQPCTHEWFKQNKPVILAIGRLTYQKNFTLLLNAFAEIADETDARLIILGEGEERDSLQQLASTLGVGARVDLPGFVDNPYPYMTAASVFIMSSRFEGLPTVLIEALQCGVPVISTDCPSGPREILEDGALGVLVPLDDIKSLATAMLRELQSSGKQSHIQQLDQYHLNTVVTAYKGHLLT